VFGLSVRGVLFTLYLLLTMNQPISKILPELNAICNEFNLEKKVVTYRNMPREHGYLKAYEIWKERNKQTMRPRQYAYTLILANRQINQAKKLS
jgi:hypothetical protein